MFDLIELPGGPFLLGLTPKNQQDLISAGTFIGISPERLLDEAPAHEVIIRRFQLAKTPVTNEQYAEFMRAKGYENHGLFRELIADAGAQVKKHIATFVDDTGAPGPSTWANGQFAKGEERHPVNGISFYEAAACARFFDVRLPSEAEWEYAAKGGSEQRFFPWGNHITGRELANFKGVEIGRTTAVGSYPAGESLHGVLDLAGNVHEWTSTHYAAYPGGVERYRYRADKTARLARGGDFNAELWDLRSTSRFGPNAKLRFPGLGMRIAR